ncbi:MAG: S-methyl-5'-thioadenosine phosphorylase [Deltaproteobacteria bacterium]|nr:S-methyl-5'-thioadenosine phosphorylase [Deltaproteobacteria bacterium]
MSGIKVGVIGGSGLYEMDGLSNVGSERVVTPYGDPSDEFVTGTLAGVPMVFLPRHGRGHRFTPSEINYRANIYGLKSLGVTHIISVSACGSLKEEIEPGQIVLITQFFDRTKNRAATFFGDGVVAHVPFADPICGDLRKILLDTAADLGVPHHDGGTYVCMEGPAFSTRAESHFYRQVGAEVIGMTNLTEAKLAREAALSYATLALATDYDCWRSEDANVDISEILKVMGANIANAKKIIAAAVPKITADTGAWIPESLKFAVVTAKESIPDKRKRDLDLVWRDYFTP